MKTRNFLFALALPAAFAACSQDEFVTEESGVSLAGRKSIGEITLVTDAQTRLTLGDNGKWNFNNGDALSAALIDVPYPGLAGQHDYAYDNYGITPFISSNYKFELKNGSWSSEAGMVEGNYMFLAPYVNNWTVRKPMEATLPAEQHLKLDASGKIDRLSAMRDVLDSKNPVFISHRFLAADAGTEQGINFYDIYSYPKITVKNSDPLRQPVIVKKVLLKKKMENNSKLYTGFTLNAPFDNKKVRNALLNEVFAPKGGDTKNQALMGSWAKVTRESFGVNWEEYKNANKNEALPSTLELTTYNETSGKFEESKKTAWDNGLFGKTSDLLGKPTKKGEYIVINFPGDGYRLNFGESVSFNAVIPADEYKQNGVGLLELYAVVNVNVGETGDEVIEVWKKNLDSRSEYLTLYPGKSYPNQDHNGIDERPNKGGYFTILTGKESDGDVTGSELVKTTEFDNLNVVTSTDELLAAIKNIHSNIKQVIVVNNEENREKVMFNKAVNDAIANTDCQEIEIQGLVYFDASDETMTVSDRVNFRDVVVEKGTVVFKGGNNRLGQVFVAPGATLTLKTLKELGNTEVGEGAVIYNAGILNVETNQGLESISNYSILNIAADLTNVSIKNWKEGCKWDCKHHEEIISMPIDLIPSVNVLAGGKYAVKGSIYYPITVAKKVGSKKAELVVYERVEIESANMHQYGTGNIVNNGTILGATTNSVLVVTRGHAMTNNVDATISVNVEIEGATHTIAELVSGQKVWVDPEKYSDKIARVYNGGSMSSVEVNGQLVMTNNNARVTTITNTNEKDGEIDNTAKGVLPATMPENVVVFAKFPSMDLTTTESVNNELKKMNSYNEATKVSVFRLNGPMEVRGDVPACELTKELINGRVIELVEGASVKIGTTKFSSDCIKVSADVKCEGKGNEVSEFSVTPDKGYYRTTKTEDGKEYAAAVEGSFTAVENSVKITELTSSSEEGTPTTEE